MKSILLLCLLTSFAWADPGVGVVVDRRGNIYYTDLSQVWKINVKGEKKVVVPNVHTHELYIDHQDNLYGEHLWYEGGATDTWRHYVWNLTPKGKIEKVSPDTEGFLSNYSFVRDHWGRMYWADRTSKCSRVVRRNKDGSKIKLGNECAIDMGRIISAWNGSIFYIDNFDLKKIDIDGKHTLTLAKNLYEKNGDHNAEAGRLVIMGIWADITNNVYVAVYAEGAVKMVTPRGQVTTVAVSHYGWAPTGGLVDPKGNLWVLECSKSNEVRLRKVTANGLEIYF